MIRALIFTLAATLPAYAQAPARAVIDCGTLQGSGTVRVYVGDRVLRVDVDCGRSM